jgi:hypothetical protein
MGLSFSPGRCCSLRLSPLQPAHRTMTRASQRGTNSPMSRVLALAAPQPTMPLVEPPRPLTPAQRYEQSEPPRQVSTRYGRCHSERHYVYSASEGIPDSGRAARTRRWPCQCHVGAVPAAVSIGNNSLGQLCEQTRDSSLIWAGFRVDACRAHRRPGRPGPRDAVWGSLSGQRSACGHQPGSNQVGRGLVLTSPRV